MVFFWLAYNSKIVTILLTMYKFCVTGMRRRMIEVGSSELHISYKTVSSIWYQFPGADLRQKASSATLPERLLPSVLLPSPLIPSLFPSLPSLEVGPLKSS